MKRKLLFLACLLSAVALYAQTPLSEYYGKIDLVGTSIVGVVSLILTEIFNVKTGTTKINALIVALVIAASISVVLVAFGVPNLGFADVFTAASILFALFKKLTAKLQE